MGLRVESVSILDGEAGTSSRARLALSGDDVPASVFVKLSAATAATRMLGELADLGRPSPGSTASWHPLCGGDSARVRVGFRFR